MSNKAPDYLSLQGHGFDEFIDFMLNTIIAYDLDSLAEGQTVTHPDLESTITCVRLSQEASADTLVQNRTFKISSFALHTIGRADDVHAELVTIRNAQSQEVIDRKLYFPEEGKTIISQNFSNH
jgi:hypothetical protein